jgi:DNA-binding IclR family transcriptional regulator
MAPRIQQNRSVMAQAPTKGVTVQSVERAASMLQAFFEEGRPLSMTEIAARTALAPATAHRMLSTLLKLGWIERDARNSRYELSERMIGNAALVVANSPLLHHGYPLLQRLTDATGLNSFLAVLVSRGSVLLARVHGNNGTTLDFQAGKVLPLHASASGKVFLAGLDDNERAEYLERQGGQKRITGKTLTDPESLMLELESVKQLGYAMDRGELYDDYRSIAVPVRRQDGSIAAALCLGGWPPNAGEAFEQDLLRHLKPTADEFSRQYGQFEPW